MRRDVFFYGTLLDADVRAAVLGVHAPFARLVPATLRGYRRAALTGLAFPALLPAAAETHTVEGQVLTACSHREWAWLKAYEGSAYTIDRVNVATPDGPRVVDTFLGGPLLAARDSGQEWSFEEWEKRHKRAFVKRLA